MCDTHDSTMPSNILPDYLGILYIATAGQNGTNLGTDEEEVVLLSLSIVQRDLKKVLASTSLLVQPRGKSSADINENEHSSSSDLLSEECKAELGISENELREKGKPLVDVISELDTLIRRHVEVEEEVIEDETKESRTRSSMSFAFITEGQLPLRQCLHPEACTKDILLPEYYYSFFDLKKEFCACYNQECETTQEMVKFLELKVCKVEDGDESRVTEQTELELEREDECNRNPDDDEEKKSATESNYKAKLPEMTAVVMRLLEDVNTFQKPESIMVKLEPGICSKNESVDGNCVVRARRGGVALCLSPQGRRNGEALIRFESLEHRDMALKRHKHHIANRYIEVYKASGEDFLSVAGGNNNEAQAFLSKGGQVIIRMRGLPYDCTPKQVVEFFDSGENACKVLDGEEGVLFVKRPDGRATGDAFVQFQHEDDASNALAKNRESIGARYIELFRSTTAEVQQPPSNSQLNGPSHILPQHIITSGTRKDCIRLRGLPYEAQVEHILEFLGEHAKNIVYQGVHMVYNAQGKVLVCRANASGEAFIQMDSEQSAYLAAQSKHHRYMHHFKKQRYIEVFQCSGDDMNLVLTGGIPKHNSPSSVSQATAQLLHAHPAGMLSSPLGNVNLSPPSLVLSPHAQALHSMGGLVRLRHGGNPHHHQLNAPQMVLPHGLHMQQSLNPLAQFQNVGLFQHQGQLYQEELFNAGGHRALMGGGGGGGMLKRGWEDAFGNQQVLDYGIPSPKRWVGGLPAHHHGHAV
ncbi:RNA-binding protein fusilli [Orchesella cincta]|uniref:RNA-binding protein fusilli n=1 Tax=Orchesella cincta TaxID=48709 RepID=A0A1D2NBX2_ORCCI|nr:RNA-binding protein fusilli [Orchesella cincta]